MKKNMILLASLCAFLAIGLFAQAPTPVNIEGNWTLIVHHPDPKKYFTEALMFRQDGKKLMGEFKRVYPVLKGDDHSMEGVLDGNKISFDVWHHSATPGNPLWGNNSFTYYRGTVNGNTMSGIGNVNGEEVTWMAKKGITGEFREGKF